MIEFNYRLTRDEKDEVRTYVPKGIPTTLPEIVYIEGPNSSGKSTLLNIMALAFYGLKSDKISPQLKSKLRTLAESNHQKLEFEVKIGSEKNGLELVSKKISGDSAEIDVKEITGEKENGLSADLFSRRYNLIYDIPDNPTTRLNLLVNELRDIQNKYASDVFKLHAVIRSTIKDIKDSRDPSRIAELEKSQGILEGEITRLEGEFKTSSELLREKEVFWLARTLASQWDETLELKQSIDTLDARRDKVASSARRVETKYSKQIAAAKAGIEDLKVRQKMVSSAMSLLLRGDDRSILKAWDKIELENALKDYEFAPSVPRTLREFRGILDKLISSKDRKSISEAQVLSELIVFLKKYRDTDIVIPGLDKTVEDFIGILNESRREYESLQTLIENVQKAYQHIEGFETSKRELERTLPDLGRVKQKVTNGDSSNGENHDQIDDLLQTKRLSLKEAEQRYSNTLIQCAKRDFTEKDIGPILAASERSETLAPYLAYDDKQLEKAIESAAGDVHAMDTNIKRMTTRRTIDGKEYMRLKRAEPHRYQDRLEDLNCLQAKCEILIQRFGKIYKSYLEVIDGNSRPALSPEEGAYFEAVASFLGKKLGTIRHIDRDHKVASVDLLKREVMTQGGKVVHLDDMGTGQSQSAYIVGLLNAQDHRKIIALFDEVAMMDNDSLGRVYSKLNELHRSGKLLAGIVVQRGEALRVESRIGM